MDDDNVYVLAGNGVLSEANHPCYVDDWQAVVGLIKRLSCFYKIINAKIQKILSLTGALQEFYYLCTIN